MSLIDLLIPAAHAQAAGAAPSPGMSTLILPIVLVGVMYFLMIRPQMKRAKEHRKLVAELAVGDEVVTNGGLLGRITKVGESFVTLELADNVQIRLQRHAVSSVMPKGTIKSA